MLTEVDILRIMQAKAQLAESIADDSDFDSIIDDEIFEMMDDDTPVSETNGLMWQNLKVKCAGHSTQTEVTTHSMVLSAVAQRFTLSAGAASAAPTTSKKTLHLCGNIWTTWTRIPAANQPGQPEMVTV